jgi:hypothetical protein
MTQTPNNHPPKHFKVTPLRRAFLDLLVEYVNLTTNDFYRLIPSKGTETSDADVRKEESRERAIRQALKTLAERGVLVRRRWFDDERTDTPFPVAVSVYSLSKEGLQLAREKGISNGQGKHAEDSSRRNESVGHELAITRFHLALDRLPRKVLWRQTDLRRTVNPDALFEIVATDGQSAHYYFLEIEKSKQGHYRNGESGLMKKLRLYHEYQGSEACKRDWRHFNRFRVIVVVKNEERRQNLLLALAEKLNTRTFWITTEAACQADISEEIFLTPRDYRERAYSLIGSN